MELYRCNICGEVYAGNDKLSHCPFCGVHQNYLNKAENWEDENVGVDLSEQSRKYLEETLELEISASRFYRGIPAKSENVEIQSLFKYLAKIEKEHAEVASKLLGRDVPAKVTGVDNLFNTDKENLEESLRREEKATDLYRGFAEEAEEKRIKIFFRALSEVENDHIEKDKEELENI